MNLCVAVEVLRNVMVGVSWGLRGFQRICRRFHRLGEFFHCFLQAYS